MLLAPLQYSAAHAAVQTDLSRLIDATDRDRLLGAASLEESLSVLGEAGYGEEVAAARELAPIERRLRRALAERLRLPLPYLRGAPRLLLDWLARRFEIEDLTIIVRGIHGGVPPSRRGDLLLPLTGSDLDWRDLASAGSISELSKRLEASPAGRPYARALAHALHEYQRRDRPFVLEVALQLAYYRRLRGLMDRASGDDARWVERFVGAEIDRENVTRAYRARIFFRLEPEAIIGFKLPRGDRVGSRMIRRIATGAPPHEVAAELWGGELRVHELLREQEPRAALVTLEHSLRRYRHRLAREALVGHTLHLGALFAHAVLVEDEVHDLIAMLEGKASGWPAERIRSELVQPAGEA